MKRDRCWILLLVLISLSLVSVSGLSEPRNQVFREAKLYSLNNMGPGGAVSFIAINRAGEKRYFWTECPHLQHKCSNLLESACLAYNSPHTFKIFYYNDMDRVKYGHRYSFAYGIEYRGEQYSIKTGENINR